MLLRKFITARNVKPASKRFFTMASLQKDEPQLSESEQAAIHTALIDALKPREIVAKLDQYIIGQSEAKRAVAIALRNRWRRHQLSPDMKYDVIPKNILMVGPTGCGKTEIARKMATLSQAPFIKVEATKFTEVGFHGKDVDQIIRDLLDESIKMTKANLKQGLKAKVSAAVEKRILDIKLGDDPGPAERAGYLDMLRTGELDQDLISIEVPAKSQDRGIDTAALTTDFLKGISSFKPDKKGERKEMTVAQARPVLEEMEAERLLEGHDVIKLAIQAVEENGIVFIDEIDKLVSSSDYRGADASSEGVQRDLLPLIEGSAISTKHGNVNTDFILFIASGAFHSSKPSGAFLLC